MKLLWFSHFIPFPPRGGNLQRSYNLIRQACRSHEVHLFALNLHSEPRQIVEQYELELRRYCRAVEICELPFPWRSVRWHTEALFSPFFAVPFSCQALFSRAILARWDQFLKTHAGALLHFDSIDLALYADSAKDFRKVLNHHNCESAMGYRRAENEKNPILRRYLQVQAGKITKAERVLCGAFDVNTVVSEQDGELLRRVQPNACYHVVENGVDTRYFSPSMQPGEPHSVIFNGLLSWGPNFSAMNFLVREIWPRVKQRFSDARLCLAGRNPGQQVLRWSREDSSITVVPNPDDMRPWIAQATVSVCPILEGGGTRLKILDAMAMGKPVVSTTIGCEGLRVTSGKDILVADTIEEFTARIIELFESEQLRQRIGAAGRALVEREYCWERIGQQLEQAYQRALQRETHIEPVTS